MWKFARDHQLACRSWTSTWTSILLVWFVIASIVHSFPTVYSLVDELRWFFPALYNSKGTAGTFAFINQPLGPTQFTVLLSARIYSSWRSHRRKPMGWTPADQEPNNYMYGIAVLGRDDFHCLLYFLPRPLLGCCAFSCFLQSTFLLEPTTNQQRTPLRTGHRSSLRHRRP